MEFSNIISLLGGVAMFLFGMSVMGALAGKTLESVTSAVAARRDKSKTDIKKVFDLEGVLDRYEDKLGSYLSKITSAELNNEQTREVNKYLRVLPDFERISDHCSNVAIDIIESMHGEFYTHEYHMDANYRNDFKYQELFNYYKIKYADELKML